LTWALLGRTLFDTTFLAGVSGLFVGDAVFTQLKGAIVLASV
jgi:hypothetical protein